MRAPRFIRHPRLQRAEQNAPPVKRGEHSDGVRVLQQALIDLGFAMPRSKPTHAANPDGIFGAETEAAVISFQRKQRLEPDGTAGRMTLGRLDQIFLFNDPFFGNPFQDNPRSFAYLNSRFRPS